MAETDFMTAIGSFLMAARVMSAPWENPAMTIFESSLLPFTQSFTAELTWLTLGKNKIRIDLRYSGRDNSHIVDSFWITTKMICTQQSSPCDTLYHNLLWVFDCLPQSWEGRRAYYRANVWRFWCSTNVDNNNSFIIWRLAQPSIDCESPTRALSRSSVFHSRPRKS